MTYRFRNNILIMGMVFTVLCAAGFPLSLFLLYQADWQNHPVSELPSHSWWLSYNTPSPSYTQYLWYSAGIFLFIIFSFTAALMLRSVYRRTASAEVFFFIIFLFTIPFEALRSWNALLSIKGAAVIVTVLITRFIYFGRFFGWISLFLSSLFAIDIRYRKFGILLLVGLLISLTLTSAIPLDSSLFLSDFLYRLGDEAAVWLVILAAQLFSTINFIVASFKRQNRRFTLAALAVLLAIIGKECITFVSSPVQIVAGLVLGIAGILLFIRQMNQVYLWV